MAPQNGMQNALMMTMQADIERYAAISRRVLPFVGDTVDFVNTAYEAGQRILVEGANATMLDLDFGTYPFVTSSNPSVGGVACGLGLAPSKYGAIIGVVRPAAPEPPVPALARVTCQRVCQQYLRRWHCWGQAKAYTTRVGAGPYPTEVHGELAEDLRRIGAEYGTTTGRPRRVGWLDIPALRYATRCAPAAACVAPPRCRVKWVVDGCSVGPPDSVVD